MPADNDINLSRYTDEKIGQALEGIYPQCHLLSGWFATVIQVLLGFLTISSLIIKRRWERPPKRPHKVWIFDVGKQASAGVLIHILNIFFALAIAEDGDDFIDLDSATLPVSECAWYLVNFVIDLILGTALVMGALQIVAFISGWAHFDPLVKLGDYGEPPQTSTWIMQLIVYLSCWIFAKAFVACLVFLLGTQIAALSVIVFAPIEAHPQLELVVVMVIGPILLNTLWFWVVDNFLMGKSACNAFADLFAIICCCCCTKRPGTPTNRYSELPSTRLNRNSAGGNGLESSATPRSRIRVTTPTSKTSSSDTQLDTDTDSEEKR